MAGNLSDEADRKTKVYQDYRRKVGAEKFDAFLARYSWTDAGKYVSHAAPAAVFLQHATEDVSPALARQYFRVVSKPKQFKLYKAPHALNAEATRDRIAFLAKQLSFKPPAASTVASLPPLVQPPWPKPTQ
jgi:hypothetical protein